MSYSDSSTLTKQASSPVYDNTAQPLLALQENMAHRLIGQEKLIDNLLIALLCDGHVLIEGMPGLAKTTAAKTLAENIEGSFHRIQFTPDLLPSDIVGTDIFLQDTQTFKFQKGPIFQNIVLADEINRAPAKVQSALLEAMGEKQVTIGQSSYQLPGLFMVIATQNPIEQEGTYPLPEAQLDRFLLHLLVDYPDHQNELAILNQAETLSSNPITKQLLEKTKSQDLITARQVAQSIYVDDKLKHYIVSLVQATRHPELYNTDLKHWLYHGASPRASLAIMHCAKALAWLQGEQYVTPEHIQYMAPNVLRHRIAISYEAQADNITKKAILNTLLQLVAVP